MHGLFSVNDNTSTKEAHRLIDEAIERHHASPGIQLALKSQRNSFAPISRLPNEILCTIFSIVKNVEPHIIFRASRITLSWVKLTHVSRHWRSVGIDSPSLWTDLPLGGERWWLEKMLLRSKGSCCLVLRGDPIFSPCFIPGLKLALEHSQRVKELSISFDSGLWQGLQETFPKIAPQLECLRLESHWLSTSPAHRRYSKPSLFSSEEVLARTPKLRRLELTNFEFDWKTHSRIFQHALTHLMLRNIFPNSQMTWKRFADILKGMPDLQKLHLDNAFPKESGKPVSGDSTAHFASLRTLFINCNTTQADAFFSCITFPPTTTLMIKCLASSQNAEFSGVLTHLAQLYSNILDTYFQTLILLGNTSPVSTGIVFKLFVDALGDKCMLAHDEISAPLECILTWGPSHSDSEIFTKTMNGIFSCGIPLQDINRVCLPERIFQLKPAILANTVGKLTQVRSVMTSNGAGRLFIDALQLNPHAGEATSELTPFKTPYFRNLSEIYFYGTRFRAPYKRQIQENDPRHLPVELLNKCLIQCSRSGMGLTKLTFRCCRRMLKADVVLYGKVVGDVDWDGLRLN